MNVGKLISFVIISMLTAACTPGHADEAILFHAEDIVSSYPDSALTMLESLPTDINGSHSFSSRIALVQAQAAYKTRQKLPDESVFEQMINVFTTNSDNLRLAKAFFLSGYHKMTEFRYSEALIDLLSAQDYSIMANDTHTLGLAQRNIADAFDMMDDNASALSYYRKSVDSFSKNPEDSLYLHWGIFSIARALNNLGNYEASYRLSDSLLSVSAVTSNLALYRAVLNNQALAALNKGDCEHAIELYELLKNTGEEFSELHYYNIGRAYLNLGLISQAKAYNDSLQQIIPGDRSLELSIARVTKNNDKIYDLINSDIAETNSKFDAIFKRDFASVIDQYYNQIAQKRKVEVSIQRRKTTWFFLGLLLCASAVVALLILIARRKEARIVQTLSLVEALSNDLSKNNNVTDNLRQELTDVRVQNQNLQDLNKQNLKTAALKQIQSFNEICDCYLDSKDDKKQLFLRISRMIEQKSSQKNLLEIERDVNRYFDNIVSNFRRDFSRVPEADINLFILTVAGYKAPAIALFLKTSVSNVYSRKYKLKSKLQASDAVVAAPYTSYL